MNSFVINPFERIGMLHNEGLDYVIKNLSSEPDINEVIRIVSEYGCSLLRPDRTFSESEVLVVSSIVGYSIVHLNDIQSVYKNSNLKEIQIVFLEKLLCINPYVKLENQYEEYRKIEYEIFAYPMPYKDKELLLIASAVGKHSAQYWTSIMNNPKSRWHKFLTSPNHPGYPLAKKTWTKEDAKGAVSGAINGGAAGIGGGIGGVLAGAAIGAVTGAVGSSVASALFD